MMTPAMSALEAAITEASRLEKVLKAGRPRVQVTLLDERSLAKVIALTWFSSHREPIVSVTSVDEVDAAYKSILEASERAGARAKYLSTLKVLKRDLVRLRSDCASMPQAVVATADQPPNFAPLISDQAMQQILLARWEECIKCIKANVPLAATVMMGGLLEALLLARINREPAKKSIFTANASPKDHSKKTKLLSDWTLKDFIDVAYELGWISVSAKEVGAVLRDYRNYIHPQKQLSHGVHLKSEDAVLFWEICKNITRQIISSVP
jgi:hypothetical protein